MLGWLINVWRQVDPPDTSARTRRGFIAGWEAGIFGTAWLDTLVKEGRAVSLGGTGYPCRYTVTAAVLASTISSGPPRHTGPTPLIMSEDRALPAGGFADFEFDQAALAECTPDEELIVDAWDLS